MRGERYELSILGEEKRFVSVRYSPRVVDCLCSIGTGCQTRMDAVLLAYVDRQERRGR